MLMNLELRNNFLEHAFLFSLFGISQQWSCSTAMTSNGMPFRRTLLRVHFYLLLRMVETFPPLGSSSAPLQCLMALFKALVKQC